MTGVFGEGKRISSPLPASEIRQIIAQSADCELVYGHRLRQVMRKREPDLSCLRQGCRARNLDYARRPAITENVPPAASAK
jgi:hypothetical protein